MSKYGKTVCVTYCNIKISNVEYKKIDFGEHKMKTLELYIITDEKRIKYFIEEPETDEEYDKGLAGRDSLPEKHGMIYLKRDPREIMAIRKNYRIERDNVANMMKYIENRLNNAHLIRNKRHRRRISPSNMRKKAKK